MPPAADEDDPPVAPASTGSICGRREEKEVNWSRLEGKQNSSESLKGEEVIRKCLEIKFVALFVVTWRRLFWFIVPEIRLPEGGVVRRMSEQSLFG